MKLAFSTRIDCTGRVVDTRLRPFEQGKSWESSYECGEIVRSFFYATTKVQPVTARLVKGAADWQAVSKSGQILDIEVKWSTRPHSFSLIQKDMDAHERGNRCLMLSCYTRSFTPLRVATYWLPPGSEVSNYFNIEPHEGYYVLRPKDPKDM